jgi:hypothetical protein
VTVVVLLMFLRVDGHAHPGMDTALKFGGLSLGHQGASCACVSINKDIAWARRLWHELSIYHLRALGSRDRIAGCGIQRSDKPAAEFNCHGFGDYCTCPGKFRRSCVRRQQCMMLIY